MSKQTQGRRANQIICRPRQDLRAKPTCCLWNASDIICKGKVNVNTQIKGYQEKDRAIYDYFAGREGQGGRLPVCASQKHPAPRVSGHAQVAGTKMRFVSILYSRLSPLSGRTEEKRRDASPPFRSLRPISRYSSARRGPWWRRRRSCGYTGLWPRRALPSRWRPSGCCSSPSASRGRRRPCRWGSG